VSQIINLLLIIPIHIKPFGPHINPNSKILNKPVRFYLPNLNKNLIGKENKNRTIIYQWINLINGKIYVGSAWCGSRRLLSYWTPSTLKRNLPIYNSINYYHHNNFMLIILEDLGKTGTLTKEFLLYREQYYLNILFKDFYYLALNNSPTAGSNLGFKHKLEFGFSRKGNLNPMAPSKGREFSPEFLNMQKRDKTNKNNPLFGTKKSPITLAKIIKLVYVYNCEDLSFLGSYPTVECSKKFKLGKDTLSKYLKSGLPFKGKLYSRIKLHK